MARFYATDPSNFVPTPPYTESLEALRRSTEEKEYIAWANAQLVRSAPTEQMAYAEAEDADEAMSNTLRLLGQAIPQARAALQVSVPNTKESNRVHNALDDLWRRYVSAREASNQADDVVWGKWGHFGS